MVLLNVPCIWCHSPPKKPFVMSLFTLKWLTIPPGNKIVMHYDMKCEFM